MKQNERMEAARNEAVEKVNLENAALVGTGEYVVSTEFGYVKVKFSAVKDVEYDVENAVAEYQAELAVRATKAEARETAKAAKLAAKEAKAAKA